MVREITYSEFLEYVCRRQIVEAGTIAGFLRHFGVLRENFLADVRERAPRVHASIEGLDNRNFGNDFSCR